MTTILALARNGQVLMAADSLTNVYERPIPGGIGKIVRLHAGDGQPLLLGCCGAGGLPGVIRAHLKVDATPADDQDPDQWAHAVAEAVTSVAAEAHLFDDGRLDGSIILGWGGRVWTLGTSRACAHRDGIAAVGSGEGPAIGALDALLANEPLLTNGAEAGAALVTAAMSIAISRDKHSGGSIQLEYLPAATAGEMG